MSGLAQSRGHVCPACRQPLSGPHDDICPLGGSPDPVNHPDHYQSASGLECIDAIRAALTPDEFRGYCKGAALKYIWREAKKGQNESLAKAVWYLNEAQK